MTMKTIFSWILTIIAQGVLYSCGIHVLTWQWWVIVICFCSADALRMMR